MRSCLVMTKKRACSYAIDDYAKLLLDDKVDDVG